MTRFLCAVLLGIFAAAVSSGQVVGTLRTGFAVITPLTSDSSVFSVSETFTERFQGNLLQSSVTPSPLVTLTSMVINLDPASGTNTGIAIVDPFDVPATVTLSLVNRQGITISARTIRRRRTTATFAVCDGTVFRCAGVNGCPSRGSYSSVRMFLFPFWVWHSAGSSLRAATTDAVEGKQHLCPGQGQQSWSA
jgi:hypothetical protein